MDPKSDMLREPVEHIDIKQYDVSGFVEAMQYMAFSSRDLARAAKCYELMLHDRDCSIFLGVAGSLVSAGLKFVLIDLIENNMVDAIVATGANIVDQDFFEALGFRHYIGTKAVDDHLLRKLAIDRIYDTFIDEEQLKMCDMTVAKIATSLPPRPYSSREFIREMGRYLEKRGAGVRSIVHTCYRKGVPIFCPAFSDSSAGFGLVHHQWNTNGPVVSIDSAKDFLELTKVKLDSTSTGIVLLGGGVPKNFIQDTVVAGEVLGFDTPMHKYAIQITVADERDGALSGSTLKEACSWGKVDTTHEQMVFSEATIALPLVASYVYHRGAWRARPERRLSEQIDRWHTQRTSAATAGPLA